MTYNMQVPFDKLSDEARVWIYPASRPFSSNECDEITTKLNTFLNQWTAHGASLNAAVTIPYNRFIVIGLDSDFQSPSGCSIDSSVHFIQNIEKSYKIVLLDKMNVTFKQGAYLVYKSLTEFKKMIKTNHKKLKANSTTDSK